VLFIQHGVIMLSHNFNTEELIDQWIQEEDQGVQYPVDLDIAWQLAGYKKKQDGVISVQNNLIEGVDFLRTTVKNPSGKGRSIIQIKMSCDGLKQFCLLARTDQGRQIRQYFIECEKNWKTTQQVFPQVAQSIEDIRIEKQIELERVRLANNQTILENNQLDHTMLQIHGKETVLLLRGHADSIVTVETVVTEVLDLKTNKTEKFLSSEQLTTSITKKTGQKVPSMKWVVESVKKIGRDDLITTVTRPVVSEYVKADSLDEVITLLFDDGRQRLLGE